MPSTPRRKKKEGYSVNFWRGVGFVRAESDRVELMCACACGVGRLRMEVTATAEIKKKANKGRGGRGFAFI